MIDANEDHTRREPMLVLSRKLGERIMVPQYGVEITVVAVNGNTVRLGVAAPDAVAVYREEIWHKLRGQCQELPMRKPAEAAFREKEP
jgi:carbon storage regulator